MGLGRRFQELRKLKSISVYKLSKVSEVPENYIHAIKKGDSQPTVEILEKLLKCLGCYML